ncbi:hypothetical protein OG196_09755 [Kitasatospora purpeofusca]|uniref:hypothetical protein n=1 Tax=Kitasatospora purpeofusca TaxID=67352 RepID=UPI002E107ADB|nr:hypothetical protein OG196_09755 [Kitasatospora purpeofusca]
MAHPLLLRIALLLGVPLLAAAVLLLPFNALLLRIALLTAHALLGVALLTAVVLLLLTLHALLLGVPLLPHALAAVAVLLLLLLGILLPLPVLLAGDRLLTAVPGVTRMPRLGALGAVAPTQIGH